MGRPRKYDLETMFPTVGSRFEMPYVEADVRSLRACIVSANQTYLKDKGVHIHTQKIGDKLICVRMA
jgi:hypothetical protein